MATGDFDHLSRKHLRLPACQKQNSLSDILRLDQLAHGDQQKENPIQVDGVSFWKEENRGDYNNRLYVKKN